MAVSKVLLAKSFVALSTTSAIGTGALKFFSTKNLPEIVNEELKRRFKEKRNWEVLENAGFKDASTDRNILKKSLELRLTSEKVTDELVGKLEKFCKEGMKASFEGITEVYKTLATVCSRTILLESKVKRDNLVLSKDSDISEKLTQITNKHRERKFINSLENETAEELFKACEKFGSKDVFSYEVSKEELADYMTFCVEGRPSSIRFWTGVENPVDVVDYWSQVEEEEKEARERQVAEERAEQQRIEAQRQLEKQKQEAKEKEEKRQAELARQQAEKERKAREAAELRKQQEAQRQAAIRQRQEDVKAAKTRFTSLGFKVNESNPMCASRLNLLKDVSDLKLLIRNYCYSGKYFHDRAKEMNLKVFQQDTDLDSLEAWWEKAKYGIEKLNLNVWQNQKWNDVKTKVKYACLTSLTDVLVRETTTDEAWKKYLTACVIDMDVFKEGSRTKKAVERGFWSTEPLES